ncbi:hypothetical protein BC833DRAFT_532154 [Globomyces pollinis-pini]|nr:hypothetical protein BC833DRAFT_532154 [Globomyces pollinis-pini]
MFASFLNPQPCLVFVHGFMGSAESFHTFPTCFTKYSNDIKHFEYDTKGDNAKSILALNDFLLDIKNPSIVLLCHSMGGPLAVDTYKQLPAYFQPSIKGILAFDSPFFSLHPDVIAKDGLQRASNIVNKASSIFASSQTDINTRSVPKSSSSGSGWGFLAAAVSVGAVAYGAYTSNSAVKSLVDGQANKASEALQFLSPLWQVNNQSTRFDFLQTSPLKFHGTFLRLHNGSRFCTLPPQELSPLFTFHDMIGSDSIDAHMQLFNEKHDPVAYQKLVDQTLEKLQWILGY